MSDRTVETELVVIGGGGSGLAAALRAREAGVEDVIVLEKSAQPGGNAWVAVVMLGLGDRVAPDEDMTAWRDQTFLGLMQASEWTRDPKIIRTYVDTYPDVVRWLIGKGMKFDIGGFDLGGRRFTTLCMNQRLGDHKVTEPSRGPGFIGSTATGIMLRDSLKLGVRAMTRTRATRILLDETESRVCGVTATDQSGDLTISSRAVVLAAGGFGANKEMMREYFPGEYRDGGPIETLCLGTSTGDGHVMAKEIGLQMGADLDSGIMGPSHHPWSHSIHETVHRPETLWVNRDGERFVNEIVSILGGVVVGRQPGGYLWALFDTPLRDYMKANPSARQLGMGGADWLRTLSEDLEKEAAWKRKTVAIAHSWEEMARKLEMDPDVLGATVQRYNEQCVRGRDEDFVKAPEFLRALHTPPYYAVLGVRFCHGTSGGARVNERMEVTGRRGQRIEGLYATGDNTSGWVTHVGLPGTTLGFAFTSGYVAGEQVAGLLRP